MESRLSTLPATGTLATGTVNTGLFQRWFAR
jgi:hypothetical protein